MDDSRDLDVLLRSRVPLILAETAEETRLVSLFRERIPTLGRPLFRWSVARGLTREDLDGTAPPDTAEPAAALRAIADAAQPGVYLLADFHPFLEDPLHVRLLKEIALAHERVPHTVVLISYALTLPPELRAFAARYRLRLPDDGALQALVHEVANRWRDEHNTRVTTDRATLDRLIDHLRGLPLPDARRLVQGAVYDDGAITADDLPEVQRAKYRLMASGGALRFEYDTVGMHEVGGLRRLKAWLRQRADSFTDPSDPLDPPRGILLLGVQGAGKSLAAKAVAGLWQVPLLHLDVGALYSKYYGESEANLRDALETAETVAPCVLWVDEIDKALVPGGGDDGVSRRLLGSLLTWLAEHRHRVFLVATANAIDRLPPELIRKGRLDEIFFVDLPDAAVRREILGIQLKRRGFTPADFDLRQAAAESAGFSGAELEQAVVAAAYSARAEQSGLTTDHLIGELSSTRPLSVVRAESLAALRDWARERTVPAN